MTLRNLLALWCLCTAAPVYTQVLPDTLDLEEFIELATERSLDKYQSDADLELAELDYRLFRTDLKPQLMATANFPNYQRTVREITQPNGTIRFQPVRNNNSVLGLSLTQQIPQTGGTLFVRSNLQRFDDFESDDRFYNGIPLRVGLLQPLFGFNGLKWDKEIEPIRLSEARKQYRADRAAIRSEATRLFFNLLNARTEVSIAEANRRSNQELYEIARERHELGKISDSDLIQLRVNLVSAQRSEQNARQILRDRSAEMISYLGLIPDGQILITEIPSETPNFSVNPDRALQEALANRAETERFQRQILEAERNVAQAKGEGGFQADLSASIGFTRSARDLEMIYTDPQQEQLVQIQLSVPILDWGRQRSRVDIREAQRDLTRQQVRQSELEFRTDVQQTVQQFVNLQQEVELARELQELAQQRFDIARESYRLGAINVTDLIFSQQEKDLAQRTYIFALGDYWQAYYRLQQLTLFDFENQQPITD